MIGWIKIHRQITSHWVWQKPEYFQWWMDILIEANFIEKTVLIKGQLITVKRGDVIYSYETWAKRWKTNKSKVMRFLKLLEKDGMIRTKSETVTTRITICNYDTYQSEIEDSETQVKRRRNASETQVNPTKEGNKEKNVNEESHNQIFRDMWKSEIWLEATAIKFKSTTESVRDALNEFRTECILKANLKENEKEAKSHFISWLKTTKTLNEQKLIPKQSSIKNNWW